MRSTAITVSLNAGCYAASVRHGFELLQELKNSGNTQVGIMLLHEYFKYDVQKNYKYVNIASDFSAIF